MGIRTLSLDETREYFAQDKFATECLGARIDSVEPGGKTVVSMDIDPSRHCNAQGFIMGGVFLALADFALAVCSNTNQVPCCSTNHCMDMMNRCKGSKIIATAICTKDGRSLGFYEVSLHDELGTHIARMTATVMRTPQVPSPFYSNED